MDTRVGERHLAPPEAGALALVLIADGHIESFPLPAEGTVTVGRSPSADVQIAHTSMSRQHARIHIGERLEIEDLGSVNGTHVRGEPLVANERAEIRPGDSIQFGSATVLVQSVGPKGRRPRRIWRHDYFELRLDEECSRATRSNGEFAVVRIHRPPQRERVGGTELLSSALRSQDVLALYAPHEYELLLIDADRASVDIVIERIREAMGPSAKVGTALFPTDGRDPDTLMARACAAVIDRAPSSSPPPRIVIASARMRELHQLAAKVARGQISVLLLGETGVGKEIFAQQIHRQSRRARGPFVGLNCAAVPENLLESELFGHLRGSFTGAVKDKRGLIAAADGGTLFLDEIGDMPPAIQAKLLRAIETREITPVGSVSCETVDVRFVAATHRDLLEACQRGTFRADLYFRLNGVSLTIPPLRERREEIVALSENILSYLAARDGREQPPGLSPEAVTWLERYPWPGNIRELRNVLERAILLCADNEITPAALPLQKMDAIEESLPPEPLPSPPRPPRQQGSTDPAAGREEPTLPSGDVDPDAAERNRIVAALSACGGNQTRAAKALGLSRRTLVSRLAKWNIPRPRSKPKRT